MHCLRVSGRKSAFFTVLSKACLVAAAWLLLAAPQASSYEIRLVTSSPGTVEVGDLVTFEAYLDTQGESDILLIDIGLAFDEGVFTYRPDLSDAEDYVLYAPGSGKADPPSFLQPPSNGCCDPPPIWGGNGPRKVDFWLLSNNFYAGDPTVTGTVATATNAFLGTLTFEATGVGSGDFDWGFGLPGTIFALSDNVDIQDQISTPGSTSINVIPEPSTLLLVGLGLLGLGRARRLL